MPLLDTYKKPKQTKQLLYDSQILGCSRGRYEYLRRKQKQNQKQKKPQPYSPQESACSPPSWVVNWIYPYVGSKYLFFCSQVKPENKVPIFPCPLHACSCAAAWRGRFEDCPGHCTTPTAAFQESGDLI